MGRPLSDYRFVFCTQCAKHGRPGKHYNAGEKRLLEGDRVVVPSDEADLPCPWCGNTKWAGCKETIKEKS
jgi:hypothetical protein